MSCPVPSLVMQVGRFTVVYRVLFFNSLLSAMNSNADLGELVSNFVKRYRKEFDFYEQASRMASQMLDSNLASAGLRAIVTSRAKSPVRLEEKIRQRSAKRQYKKIDDIYDDIVDLAGVRVALYFPGERAEVGKIIRNIFTMCENPKQFPGQDSKGHSVNRISIDDIYKKRFSGYSATHYRVQIPENRLNESQKRYSEAKIEIQVASVLMHAWSEVEHDLVYKPLQGALSLDEYAILDELNGLVISGEIALERLQRAGELRASTKGRPFANHYDLTASLLEFARSHLSKQEIKDSEIGRVDELYKLLNAIGKNKPDEIEPYIIGLQDDFEKRPLAAQIIDRLISEDEKRYDIYRTIKIHNFAAQQRKDFLAHKQNEALGRFMGSWAAYENILRSFASSAHGTHGLQTTQRILRQLNLPTRYATAAGELQQFRNELVHEGITPSVETLNVATSKLNELIQKIDEIRKEKNK